MTGPRFGDRPGNLADQHRLFDELAAGWALHALEPDDEELFGIHLRTCARCQAEVGSYLDTFTEKVLSFADSDPSPRLLAGLRAAITADVGGHQWVIEEPTATQPLVPTGPVPTEPVPTEPVPAPPGRGGRPRHLRGGGSGRRVAHWIAFVAVLLAAALLGWNVLLHRQNADLRQQIQTPPSAPCSCESPGAAVEPGSGGARSGVPTREQAPRS